jgi:hypothetical protein
MVADTGNPSTQETEAGESQVKTSPGYTVIPFLKRKKKTHYFT